MERTHNNGLLSLKNVGETVVLVGWVAKRRHLGSIVFIDLRDRSGIVQINIDPEKIDVRDIRHEYVIQVGGTVVKKEIANTNLATGAIEVVATWVKVINTAETTPLIIADETDALEDTRLKYRYLDLRRPSLQHNLLVRSQIIAATHQYLDEQGFMEIETPILTLSTPEGARDYLVPSRVHAGHFYALPQSPQLFKQLLMIGGLERYYQIARCFRDEDLRADRQPEFTQIDIEASFLDQEQFLTLMEGCLAAIFKRVKGIDLPLPLRRMEYEEAINVYGSDKPDTRFGLLLQDVKDLLATIDFAPFQVPYVKAIVVPQIANATTRKQIDELNDLSRKFGLKGISAIKYLDHTLQGSIVKYFSEEVQNALIRQLNLQDDDLVIIAANETRMPVLFGLGAIRSMYGKKLGLIPEHSYDLLWVVHWPMFEWDEQAQRYVANHHPFTRPCDEDLPYLQSDPSKVYAYAYDIVINGYEAGGGSLRIYDQKTQHRIFEILGLSSEDIERKFGFFIDAFRYGTPPHGGLAFGLDRLAMILNETENIRDVIAFPKNLAAVCPMSRAPSVVEEEQLKDLSLKIIK